ncbi:MAG: SpoIIE family protein phosphatase [Bacteroidetes bacterium]|nr:SpoIIE family protein phosphatase [Bacteroidota bacterium]
MSIARFIAAPFRRFGFPSETALRVIFSLTALVSFAAIVTIAMVTVPQSMMHTDDCLWTVTPGRGHQDLVVSEVIPGGRADEAGVRVGDRVLRIGTVDITEYRANSPQELRDYSQEVLQKLPVETPLDYVVERNGAILRLRILLKQQLLFPSLLVPLLSFLWLVIGLVVVLPRPRGKVQRMFFLVTVTVIFGLSFPPLRDSPLSIPLLLLWYAAGCAFFLLWLLFCTVFPVDQKILGSRFGRICISIVVADLILNVGLQLGAVAFGIALNNSVAVPILYSGIAIRFLCFVLGVLFLFRGYRRLPASADRRPVTVIVVGSILACAALIYMGFIQTTLRESQILYPQYLLPVFLLLALPISFGYAVFRYQVMDLGRVVRTTLVYTSTMALIAGLYLGLGYLIGQALGSLITEEFKGPVKVLSFALFVMLFDPVKRKLQTAIENRFFPQRRDYSGRLATYAAEITETVGAQAVAERTAITLQQALDLRGVCVAIEDPDDDGNLKPVARASEFAPVPVDGATIESLRHLLRQSHNLILLETAADPKLENLQMYFPYVIGMYAQGRVTGAILMSRPHDDQNMSGSQIMFIAGVAAQAAAALEVARMYGQELARQRYREELATARRIQESLLPAEMPTIPGISISASSLPAQAVGGDYYDVIQLGNNRFLVTVADVSGKGLPASLYMAEFHGMVHVACGVHTSPKEILTTLNEHLFEVITRGSFITASMLLFDTERHTVSYARAGHTPIIRRGREVDTLIPNGVALGLCSRELFEELLHEYTVAYEPGETFILYSDGVSEAMDAERHEFGEGRLHDVIAGTAGESADALRRRILAQVESFRGEAEQNDDITVMVIHVERSTTEEGGSSRQLPASAGEGQTR